MRVADRTKRLERLVNPPWWKFSWKRQSSEYAALQLWRSGAAAVPFLLRVVRSGETASRRAVIAALSRLGPDDADALPALILALKNDVSTPGRDPGLQLAVCKAVAEMGAVAESAVPALVEMLPRLGAAAQQAVVEVAGKMGAAGLSGLRHALQNEGVNWQARGRAAEYLEPHAPRGRGAVSALLKGLEDRYSAVRHAAARSLEHAGIHTAKDVLRSARKSRLQRAGLAAEDLRALMLIKQLHSSSVDEVIAAGRALLTHRSEGDRIWQKLDDVLAPNPEEIEGSTEFGQSVEILIIGLLTERNYETRVQYVRELGRRRLDWLAPLLKRLAEDEAAQENFRYICQEVAEWL